MGQMESVVPSENSTHKRKDVAVSSTPVTKKKKSDGIDIDTLLMDAKARHLDQAWMDRNLDPNHNQLDDFITDYFLLDSILLPVPSKEVERIMLLSDVNFPFQILDACLLLLAKMEENVYYLIVTTGQHCKIFRISKGNYDRKTAVVALICEENTHYSVVQIRMPDSTDVTCCIYDSKDDELSVRRCNKYSTILKDVVNYVGGKWDNLTFTIKIWTEARPQRASARVKADIIVATYKIDKTKSTASNDCGYFALKYLHVRQEFTMEILPQLMLTEYRVMLKKIKGKISNKNMLQDFLAPERSPGSYCIHCGEVLCIVNAQRLESLQYTEFNTDDTDDRCFCFGLYCLDCYAKMALAWCEVNKKQSTAEVVCGRCHMSMINVKLFGTKSTTVHVINELNFGEFQEKFGCE